MKYILSIMLIFISFQGLSQLSHEKQRIVDSLNKVIKEAKHDTSIAQTYITLGEKLGGVSLDTVIIFCNKAKEIAEKKLSGSSLNEKERLVYNRILSAAVLNFGKVHKLKGDIEPAFNYLNESLTLSKKIEDEVLESRASYLLGQIYQVQGAYDKALTLQQRVLEIDKKRAVPEDLPMILNSIGITYYYKGEVEKTLDYFNRSLKIHEENGNHIEAAKSLSNIAGVHYRQGDHANAIDHYMHCLKMMEEIGDEEGLAVVYHNIGNIYLELRELDKALDYYTYGLEIGEKIGKKEGIASSLHMIGSVHELQKDTLLALEYYTKSLGISESLGDKKEIASALGNIGDIYKHKGKLLTALDYYSRSMNIAKEIGDKDGLSSVMVNIGEVRLKQGDLSAAERNVQKGLALSQELGYPSNIEYSARILSKIYEKQNRGMKALEMHKLHIRMRDSIYSAENKEEVLKQELKYNYEKKQLADSLNFVNRQEVNELKHRAQLDEEKNQRYALYGGLFLVLLFALFAYNRLRVTSRQKQVIEQQKLIVDEKNREITDSILYAKRIQEAIVPHSNELNAYLKNGFVYYRPKDIVAGDFYWLEKAAPLDSHKGGKKPPLTSSKERETAGNMSEGNHKATQIPPSGLSLTQGREGHREAGPVFYATADCTGHGVPGAMVSVVCHGALNRAVREFKLTDPALILTKVKELIIETFDKGEDDVRDGMDIALCLLDFEKMQLQFAGANRPLYIIRNKELIEVKPDSQPVGKYYKQSPFTTHKIDLQKGDTLYTFTDGFPDQFGGPKRKKFKYKPFKELLLSIQDKTMDEQHDILDKTFEEWKAWPVPGGVEPFEQIDDVCVIGVRI